MELLQFYPVIYHSLNCFELRPNEEFIFSNKSITKSILNFTSFLLVLRILLKMIVNQFNKFVSNFQGRKLLL